MKKKVIFLFLIFNQLSLASNFSEFLIKSSRLLQGTAFWSRIALGTLGITAVIKAKDKSEDASEDIKEFCYNNLGRKDFNIKFVDGILDPYNMLMGFNTLYLPKDSFLIEALKNKDKINSQEKLNLAKGFLDHEIRHLDNKDYIRGPVLYFSVFYLFEKLWNQKMKPLLEANFKNNTLDPSLNFYRIKLFSRWILRLGLPTAVSTSLLLLGLQVISRKIERDADKGTRNDKAILTELLKYYQKNTFDRHWIFDLISTHPSNQARAEYFAKRLAELN